MLSILVRTVREWPGQTVPCSTSSNRETSSELPDYESGGTDTGITTVRPGSLPGPKIELSVTLLAVHFSPNR